MIDCLKQKLELIEQAHINEISFFNKLGLSSVFDRLDADWKDQCDKYGEFYDKCPNFSASRGILGGEIFFVPDCQYYQTVFDLMPENAIVLDAGAGDLRFAMALSTKVKLVYAVEINPTIIGRALSVIGYDLPINVITICTDCFRYEIPTDVTDISCIMIHRAHKFPKSWLTKRIVHAEFDGVHIVGDK